MTTKIKIIDSRYNLYIMPLAKKKMELYCELCQDEIGWLSYVTKLENNKGYLITDCVLLKQETNGGTTEINPSALLELWASITPEQQNNLKCWGHSHVNMAPNPSGQDDSQMDYFKDGNDWFIRVITNKKGELNIDFYDFDKGIQINMDSIIVYDPSLASLRVEVETEIKDKVSKKAYATASYKGTDSKSVYPIITESYRYSDEYYKAKPSSRKVNNKKSSIEPLFTDIEIKYLKTIDDALNDVNYWQSTIAY